MGRLVACFVMLAMLPSTASAAPSVVGTWFGNGQPDDKLSMYLEWFLPNGDFRAHHRTCIKGKTLEQWQQGRWSVAGDILTVNLHRINDLDRSVTYAYRVLSADTRKLHYVFLPDNFAYDARRVRDDFRMPSCDLTS